MSTAPTLLVSMHYYIMSGLAGGVRRVGNIEERRGGLYDSRRMFIRRVFLGPAQVGEAEPNGWTPVRAPYRMRGSHGCVWGWKYIVPALELRGPLPRGVGPGGRDVRGVGHTGQVEHDRNEAGVI